MLVNKLAFLSTQLKIHPGEHVPRDLPHHSDFRPKLVCDTETSAKITLLREKNVFEIYAKIIEFCGGKFRKAHLCL